MRDENEFYTDFGDEEDEKDSWREKIKNDVSRIEGFIQEELEGDTQTERNLQDYREQRERRNQGKEEDWMEELDHVTFGFIVIELILLSYFLLAWIGITPMF